MTEDNVAAFLRLRAEARVLFPELAQYAIVTQTGPDISWEHFNVGMVPQYNVPQGFDIPSNQNAALVCYHEPGHEYAEWLDLRDPLRKHRQAFLALIGETGSWDSLKAVADAATARGDIQQGHAADPGEWWADAFADAVAGIPKVGPYLVQKIDPLALRAFFQSLAGIAPSALAAKKEPAMSTTVLWHLSHHSHDKPDGWSGAPDEARWVREDLTPLVEYACRQLGIDIVLVDGDLQDHPAFHDDYLAFVAPHYEANLHSARGWFWGRATQSATAAADDRLGRIFERRYAELTQRTNGPAPRFDWSNPNVTDYYGFRLTSANTPGILVEHGVGWRIPADYDFRWLRSNVQQIADVWARTLQEFAGMKTGGPKVLARLEDEEMTPEQEAKLDRVLALLDARESLVWLTRMQRGLDIERGKAYDPNKPPIDPRVIVK